MNEIPKDSLVQILSREEINFKHYYTRGEDFKENLVYWGMTEYCGRLGVIISLYDSMRVSDFYQIKILDAPLVGEFAFHKSSFKVVAPEKAGAILSI